MFAVIVVVATAMKWKDEPVVCGHPEIKHLMRDHSHSIETTKQMNERERKNPYMRFGCTDSFHYNSNLI